MAIAYDTTTVPATYASTGTQTVSHAGSASARAAVVLITQNGAGDQVTGVTYNGVAMSRVRSDAVAGESGYSYIYFLDGVTTGTQNVAMTTNSNSTKQMVISTMTADSGWTVSVAGHYGHSNTGSSNPFWDITGLTNGTALLAYMCIHSGANTMTTTPQAGWSRLHSADLGSQGNGFAFLDVPSQSGTTLRAGWNTSGVSASHAGSSVAFIGTAPTNLDKLRIGTSIPSSIKVGSNTATAVYMGSTQVFP